MKFGRSHIGHGSPRFNDWPPRVLLDVQYGPFASSSTPAWLLINALGDKLLINSSGDFLEIN